MAHIETVYNDIFISKEGKQLSMSFQLKGWEYTQSETNLSDPDDLPTAYTRVMTTGVAFAENVQRILMIGLGGGAISTYLGRAINEATIGVVEVDPGVIAAAKKYFGIRETERVRYYASDGRVWLKRKPDKYGLRTIAANTFIEGLLSASQPPMK